jgi:hypothetical protein
MKTITLLSGICAFVLVPFGAAVAGACSAAIENVNKLLAWRDAGSGPTTGAAATSAGQHPPAAAIGAGGCEHGRIHLGGKLGAASASADVRHERVRRQCDRCAAGA